MHRIFKNNNVIIRFSFYNVVAIISEKVKTTFSLEMIDTLTHGGSYVNDAPIKKKDES